MLKMRRKIRLIHQIEITSRCNLRCKYCVHPKMIRPKVDISQETFERAIELVKYSVHYYGQTEINLCGIGESTLHPLLVDFVKYTREQLGNGIVITFSCNGLEITEELAIALKPYRPMIYISMHRPEKAGPAVEILKRHGLLCGVDANAAISATDWAGQVEWFISSPSETCFWIPDGRVFVDSEGNIRSCCYDGDGKSYLGTVWDDDIFSKETHPYVLCDTCHMNNNLE